MELVVTLILAGAALMLAETILPGLVAGILGVLCVLAGVILAYARLGFDGGSLVLALVCVGLMVGTVCWFKFFPDSRFGRVFILKRSIKDEGPLHSELMGQTGTAACDLRPSGVAVFQGKRVDVVTEGGLVRKGSAVRVVALEGFRVVVRAD